MTNNGEIRRVLGKSQKNTTSNQKELEVKKKVEEKSSANNDAVAELTENKGKYNNDRTINGNKFVIFIPIILAIIVIITIVSFILVTKDSIPAKTTQTTSTTEQKGSITVPKSDEKDVISDKKEVATTNAEQSVQSNNIQNLEKKASNNPTATKTATKPVTKSVPKNKYKDLQEYLKDVTKVIKDLYFSLYSMDNVTMLVDFKNNKYTYITGEGTRNCGGLYRFIYENQSKFPRYYDRNGNPIPIKITVNGREVTKVALAISTYDLLMERTAGEGTDDTIIDFTKNSSATTKTETPKVNKQVTIPQGTSKVHANNKTPKNEYEDGATYIVELWSKLEKMYQPQNYVDYAHMEIHFAEGKVVLKEGNFSTGVHELYTFLLMNEDIPVYYDENGKPRSVYVTVRDSKVANVGFVL